MIKKLFLFTILVFVFGCNKSSNETRTAKSNFFESSSEEYPDGEYCAEIDYYNPDTGTSSTYNLSVEIENGELVKIEWSNGGWLDDSHFSPPDITDGTASFEDDRGREFEVKLLEQGGCYGNNNYVEEEESNVESSHEDDTEENNENEEE